MVSNRAKGVERQYILGVVAAVIAVIECGVGVVLVNSAAVIAGFDLAGWVPVIVTTALVAIAICVAVSVALVALPRPHYITV